MKQLNYFLVIGIFIGVLGCVDIEETTSVSLDNLSLSIAVPLINSQSSIREVADGSSSSTSLEVDQTGKLTLYYNGEVVRNNASSIFPPIPGLKAFLIEDTVYQVGLPFGEEYVISKATFNETNFIFGFSSTFNEDVDITLRMPGLSKNGVVFEKQFHINYAGSNPTAIESEPINVDGWEIILNNNKVEFEYSAVLASGEKVVLNPVFMRFDILKFSYVEGYFGNKIFDIEGDIIDIGIFTNWKSGGINFEDPRVTLQTDNSFGFPVRSKVNKLELETVSGEILQIESEFIDIGIDFEYPTVDEIGQVKSKFFAFDKDNSNIKVVFNEKALRVSYDFDAVANPDNDTSKLNFVDEGSFFVVNVAVELPLNLTANDLILVDTIDLDLETYEEVVDATFKIKTSNDFPIDIIVQANFINEDENLIDEMFDGEGLILPAATLKSDGTTMQGIENTTFIKFDKARYDVIRATKKVEITYRLSSEEVSSEPIWIYDNYNIGFKVGAIFNIEN